jgi:FkbM family methyltransferase
MRVFAPQFLKDSVRAIPCQARYWDDRLRGARYDLRRIFRNWRNDPELRAEADQSFSAYHGGDFIDIGAFVGFYAALLAPKAKPGDRFVLCEPDPRAHPRLFANLACVAAAFPALTISVVTVPVGEGGPCAKMLPGDGPAAHFQFGLPKAGATAAVTTATVDNIVNSLSLNPSFVKIDVEGAEWNVLRGMERTFSRCQPSIAIEIHPEWLPDGVKAETIYEILTSSNLVRHAATKEAGHSREIWQSLGSIQMAGISKASIPPHGIPAS